MYHLPRKSFAPFQFSPSRGGRRVFGQLLGDSDVISILALAWRASEPIGMNRQVGSISILALAWRASPNYKNPLAAKKISILALAWRASNPWLPQIA